MTDAVPLEEVCVTHFGMSFEEAKKLAPKQKLPIPVFRLGSPTYPYLPHPRDGIHGHSRGGNPMKALALTLLLAGCSNPCEIAQFDLADASMAVAMHVSDSNRQAYQQAQADVRAQCGCSDAQMKVALEGVSDANVRAYSEACE